MTPAKLILEPAQAKDRALRLTAKLVEPDGSFERFWWEVPEAWRDAVTPWADPWVVGFLFPIMQRPRPVHVEGRVSPSLLANVELFMRIWGIWIPGAYHAVSITADEEKELPPAQHPGQAVAAFSCGLDSCFTVYRHLHGLVGRRTQQLRAGVLMHGFDVWLDQENSRDMYRNMLADATTMLRSVGLPCISMVTNFHDLKMNWGHAWATHLVSGLSLLSGRFDRALIANDLPYAWLGFRWPSHPVTDVLLGSNGFAVINDGGEHTRWEKAKVIADWPEAMRHLRVCYGVDSMGRHDNCCRCEKCTRTILAFRLAGCPKPAAFKEDVSDKQVRRMRWSISLRTARWREFASGAKAAGYGRTSWARAIRSAIRRNQWRMLRNRLQRPLLPLRNTIRKWVRGSPLSRRQLAAQRQAPRPPARE